MSFCKAFFCSSFLFPLLLQFVFSLFCVVGSGHSPLEDDEDAYARNRYKGEDEYACNRYKGEGVYVRNRYRGERFAYVLKQDQLVAERKLHSFHFPGL